MVALAAPRVALASSAMLPEQHDSATAEVAQVTSVAVTADRAVKRFHWEREAANLVAALLALAMTAKLEAEL